MAMTNTIPNSLHANSLINLMVRFSTEHLTTSSADSIICLIRANVVEWFAKYK